MTEMYGFRHDLLDCRPDAAITYLPDCDNADWEPADERWKDTFLMKLMHLYEDSYGQEYIVFPPLYWKQDEDADHMYYDCRLSNEEFPGSTCISTGEPKIFSILDNTMINIIGVMVYKRLDWKDYIRYYSRAEDLTKIIDDYFPEYSGKLSPTEISEILGWKTVKLEKGKWE